VTTPKLPPPPRSAQNRAGCSCASPRTIPPADVTAVAAVANNTPAPGTPEASADDGSDAARIFPYLQVPTTVEFDQDGYIVNPNECSEFTVGVTDQFGDPLVAANLDLHAQGPSDDLRFAVYDPLVGASKGAYRQPDRAHTGSDPLYNCKDRTSAIQRQGDHDIAEDSDRKHIETGLGTQDDGKFTFTLFSHLQGETIVTVWVDQNDDDAQGADEATGFGRIGWGVQPPPPPRNVILDPDEDHAPPGECLRVVMAAREGSTALPGVNVDVHALGPDSSVSFCIPPDATISTLPDGGEHTNGVHSDGTKHLEGQTDSTGQFVFGISSSTAGETELGAWIDDTDDDVFASTEAFNSMPILWGSSPPRRVETRLTISYRSGFFGGKVGSDETSCRGDRQVRVFKKRPGRDRVVGSNASNAAGSWVVRAPRAKGSFYATTASKTMPMDGGFTLECLATRSRTMSR